MAHPTSRSGVGAILLASLVLLVASSPTQAEEDPKRIEWHTVLKDAFQAARDQDKPLMIAINSRRVDAGRLEPAAKELRERTYKDPEVVALSRRFVCAFLTAKGSAEDFGELRLRYGIDGEIVSPQHIFAYPSGTLISRKEYWPYGYGRRAVDALLKLMNEALAADRERRGSPSEEKPPAEGGAKPAPAETDVPIPEEPEVPEAPEGAAERARWIQDQIGRARGADGATRRAALRALLEADRDGDAVGPVLVLLDETKKEPSVRLDIVRALGRPGLEAAVEPLADFLDAREDALRANAAVSLEYVGSPEAVSALMRRAPREKDEGIANHMYRALGRCGVGEAKVRKLLVKKVQGAKSSFASYGPIIGLAYFERDPKTAREVEKLLKKEGIPAGFGWRRGVGKRALLLWCLTEVGFGDPKAAKFLREEMIPLIPQNQWTSRVVSVYEAAAKVCDGDEAARDAIDQNVRGALSGWGGGGPGGGGPGGRGPGGGGPGGRGPRGEAPQLTDDARRGRDVVGFEPKGEWGTGGG